MYKLSTTSFSDCAHSVAIVSHAGTNRGYSFDQRLFVLTKTIQWYKTGSAGEDKLVVGNKKKHIYVSKAGSSCKLCKLSSYLY